MRPDYSKALRANDTDFQLGRVLAKRSAIFWGISKNMGKTLKERHLTYRNPQGNQQTNVLLYTIVR